MLSALTSTLLFLNSVGLTEFAFPAVSIAFILLLLYLIVKFF